MNNNSDPRTTNKYSNPYARRYDVPLVAGMLFRGDEAMAREDWGSAETCYIAAYYCAGGQDAFIKTKIDLASQILKVESVVGSAEIRIASSLQAPAALKVIANELIATQKRLYNLISELPGSIHLAQLAEQLKTAIIIAKSHL